MNKNCINGHNILLCGRDSAYHCKKCLKIKYEKSYVAHPINNRFCVRKHDTFKSGRYTDGHCKKYLVTNFSFNLSRRLRNRLYIAIKSKQKVGSAIRDLGCSITFLKKYIASKFYENMTWSNWGKVWQLDHIEELHTFDLTDRKQFLKAVHYTNLQPLTITDHQKKTICLRQKRGK